MSQPERAPSVGVPGDAQIAALRPSLEQTCDELALSPTPEQVDDLLRFLSLLQHWNATYNLTAVREPQAMLSHHLADCLAAVGPLRRQVASTGARTLLDVGSGGGLPGVVFAVLQPELQVHCVDAVGKKAAFVRQAAVELKLTNLHGEHARIERWTGEPCDVITSRAFASLPDFVSLTVRHLARGGVWMAMKGKEPTDEIEQLKSEVASVFHVEHLHVPGLAAERCIVWMKAAT